MSAVEERIDAKTLIPDGIEPVEMNRVWRFRDGKLRSVTNGSVWEPGEPFTARCRANDDLSDYRWTLVAHGGMTLEQAQEWAPKVFRGSTGSPGSPFSQPIFGIRVPKIVPPAGYGYAIEEIPPHDAPDENCMCGIYAAAGTSHGYTGDVSGKVKLWGKVIPGEKGVRAEFAYPSELHVPADLANDPGLLAYGVPVIVDDALPPSGDVVKFGSFGSFTEPRSKLERGLKRAIIFNVAACVLNAGFVVLHFLRWL